MEAKIDEAGHLDKTWKCSTLGVGGVSRIAFELPRHQEAQAPGVQP